MSLTQIERLARDNACAAWIPLNEWLSRYVSRASDEQLNRALALRDDLSGVLNVRT